MKILGSSIIQPIDMTTIVIQIRDVNSGYHSQIKLSMVISTHDTQYCGNAENFTTNYGINRTLSYLR